MLAQLDEDRSILLENSEGTLGTSFVACANQFIVFGGGRGFLFQGYAVTEDGIRLATQFRLNRRGQSEAPPLTH